MLDPDHLEKLVSTARLVRTDILKMLNESQSGHTGGSLSAVEIITALYFHIYLFL